MYRGEAKHLATTTDDLTRFYPAVEGDSPIDGQSGQGKKPATRQRRNANGDDPIAGRATAHSQTAESWHSRQGLRRQSPTMPSPGAAGAPPPTRSGLRVYSQDADSVDLTLRPDDEPPTAGTTPRRAGNPDATGRSHLGHMDVSANSPWGPPQHAAAAAVAGGGVRATPAGRIQQVHPWEVTGRGLKHHLVPTDVHHTEPSLDSPWRLAQQGPGGSDSCTPLKRIPVPAAAAEPLPAVASSDAASLAEVAPAPQPAAAAAVAAGPSRPMRSWSVDETAQWISSLDLPPALTSGLQASFKVCAFCWSCVFWVAALFLLLRLCGPSA